MGAQPVRVSQFVTTFGPGAILQGPDGLGVVLAPEIGLSEVGGFPERFEISDRRMSGGLLGGAGIYRLPANAELGKDDRAAVYHVKPFPAWRVCWNRDGHGDARGLPVLHSGRRCPVCGGFGAEAVRFVTACAAGHLDEVPWRHLVHGRFRGGCQHKDWFRWEGGGTVLSTMRISCPAC